MLKLYTLKNGLRVVTEKLDGVNSISFGVMIQNGSRNESEDVNGISHFIEHMFFKGTKKRTSKKIVEDIENVGGQLNAFTSKEATCYYAKALHTHLDLCIDVISDMLLNSTFDKEEIEKEKGVVIEEINMSEDLPDDVLEDIASKITYGDSPLSRPILGTKSKVQGFTRERILKFIEEKYTPENSVVSVCGKFDEKELEEVLEKYFGEWKSKTSNKVIYEENKIHVGSNHVIKEIEQLHMNLTLKGVPVGYDKGHALTLLNNVFGGGASSILFQKVREELGLCYTIYSYPHPYMGVGSLNIYTGLSKNQAPKALEVINRELNNFANIKISKEQIAINKEKIKGAYILGLESTSSRMFGNARSVLFRGRVRTQEEVIEKINKITEEDIEFVLKNTYGKGVINTSYVGPEVEYDKLNSIILNSSYAFDNNSENEKVEV
ncbi:MAG: M16 family metallopeptidase [Clostridium sp.]